MREEEAGEGEEEEGTRVRVQRRWRLIRSWCMPGTKLLGWRIGWQGEISELECDVWSSEELGEERRGHVVAAVVK